MPPQPPPLRILPNRFPDEWYLSYIFRLHLLTGLATVEHSINHIFNERLILNHDTPIGIKKLVALAPRSAGITVELLLKENTIFPYLRAFAFDYTEKEYFDRYLSNGLVKFSAATRAAGSRLGLRRLQPRFCIQCLRDDEKKWGISYFRRSHQVPEITICVTHGTTLRSGCIQCGAGPWPRYGLWPAGNCRKCGADLVEQGSSKFKHTNIVADLRIAQLITQFLEANLPLLNIRVLQETYRAALLRNGFITTANKLSARKFAIAVIDHFGEQFMREIHMPPTGSVTVTPRWATCILKNDPSTRPLEHCIIINTLFGSFDKFIEAYSQIAMKEGKQSSFIASIDAYSQIKTSTFAWRRSEEVPIPLLYSELISTSKSDQIPTLAELFLAGKSLNAISIITKQHVRRAKVFAKANPDLEEIRSHLNYQTKFDIHKKNSRLFSSFPQRVRLHSFSNLKALAQTVGWNEMNQNG